MPDSRPTTRFARPNPAKPGLKVALPDGSGFLPPEGAEVDVSHPRNRRYWARQKNEGSVLFGREDEPDPRLLDAVRAAVAAGHLTKDGKPDANTLSDMLDRKVSSEERDAAWAVVSMEE